jgi:imidazolonepropionase-like amidohydrolase
MCLEYTMNASFKPLELSVFLAKFQILNPEKMIRLTLCLMLFMLSFANAQENSLLISNANIIDVRNGRIIKDASILVREGVIQEVLIGKKMKLPTGTKVLDATSKYIIPGMTDAHIHFFQSGGLYTRPDAFNFTHKVPYEKERQFAFNNAEDYLRRYLRLGVTTVADVGGPFSNFKIRDSISTTFAAPTVLVTGPLFSMVSAKPLDHGEPSIIKTTTIAQADSLLDKMLPLKPDFIKIWYIVTPHLPAEKTFPVVQHIAKRTHDAKLKLAVHATEMKTAELAIDAGADILVHSVDDQVVTDALVRKLLARKVSYIPTLIVVNGYMQAATGILNNHPSDLAFANPFAYGSLSDTEHMTERELPANIKYVRGMKNPPSNKKADSIMALNLIKLFQAGVNIVAGTDAGNIGTMHASSFISELQAMKLAGLTNAQILKTATINSANCFGQNSGTIEKGKVADIVVLNANPVEDLSALLSAQYVIKKGKLLMADSLISESAEMLIQRQVNAYNARDIEAFLATYSDDVELYNFPDSLTMKGKDAMRKVYEPFFTSTRNLHVEIVNRIIHGNTIIDHESVRYNERRIKAIAIYEVRAGRIFRVTFKQ